MPWAQCRRCGGQSGNRIHGNARSRGCTWLRRWKSEGQYVVTEPPELSMMTITRWCERFLVEVAYPLYFRSSDSGENADILIQTRCPVRRVLLSAASGPRRSGAQRCLGCPHGQTGLKSIICGSCTLHLIARASKRLYLIPPSVRQYAYTIGVIGFARIAHIPYSKDVTWQTIRLFRLGERIDLRCYWMRPNLEK